MRSFYPLVLAITFLSLLANAALCDPTPAAEVTRSADSFKAEERLLRQVVALTNAERAKLNLPPLKLHEKLCVAAQWLAQDMADHNYFEHTDHQGRSIDPRLPDFGYQDYENLGENIAAGHSTPEEVLADWMHSPDHRANLLDPQVREIGVGYAQSQDSKFKRYWVQDFGSRFDGFPLVINDESGQTCAMCVKLTIYGETGAKKMRISNDGQTWTEWEPYKVQRDWVLPTGTGKHTVYVEVNNGKTTRRSDDTVELVEEPKTPIKTARQTMPKAAR